MTVAPPRTNPVAERMIEALEARIAARHVLNHPFYQAWNRGELTREALQDYAAQYYRHVAAFPTYLSAVHSNTDDAEARQTLLMNLIDEEAGAPNHPQLWLQFAAGLGVDAETVRNTPAQPETAALVETFRDLCRHGSLVEGVAALYAYESQIPEVSQSKVDGLRKHYGVEDEATLKYFLVHVEADEVHRAQERDLLRNSVQTEADAEAAKRATDRALEAVWNLLSGVCERHGIACH
jgi:pyrroloquinoline-quinone synthase